MESFIVNRLLRLSSARAVFALSFGFAISGCIQDYNSTSEDQQKFGTADQGGPIDTTTGAGQRFAAAKALIDTRCANCHFYDHSSWKNFSEDSFIATSRVIPGVPGSSSMYTRLKGNPGGDMPATQPELSAAERKVIFDWISGL